VVVRDATLDKKLVGDGTELPPRRDVAGGPPAGTGVDEIDAVVQDFGLLLAGHGDRILMAVAVQADLVS